MKMTDIEDYKKSREEFANKQDKLFGDLWDEARELLSWEPEEGFTYSIRNILMNDLSKELDNATRNLDLDRMVSAIKILEVLRDHFEKKDSD